MRSGFSSLSYGLVQLPTAIAIIGAATMLLPAGNLLSRLAWPQDDAYLKGAVLLAALIGWVLAWHGGRWLARRGGRGTDPRSAVLIAGIMVVSQLVRTGEGILMLVASIVFFSLPTVVAALAIGHERRRSALPEASSDRSGKTPLLSGRFLVMCLMSLFLPLVLIMVVGAINDTPASSRYHGLLSFAGFLILVLASWLLGRLLGRHWPRLPVHPAIAVVPVLLSQWPVLMAATEYRTTMLAALAFAFLLPGLAFLLGFGVFRRVAPDAAIP